MSEINLDKLQKLWNHATKNANEHEASTAALMFTKMIAKHNLKVHLYSGQSPATDEQIKENDEQIIFDYKTKFRRQQIETEGNDPA